MLNADSLCVPPSLKSLVRMAQAAWLMCWAFQIAACALVPHATPDASHAPDAPACDCAVMDARQARPLAQYLRLMAESPSVFLPKGDHTKGEVEIITDAAGIREVQDAVYARLIRHHDAAYAWTASRAGLIVEDDYILVVRDAVVFPSGETGLYDRKISRSRLDGGVAGAYGLPITADGRVVLVREWRHQERIWRLGLPGGFRDPGETAAESARREVREETGCDVPHLIYLGDVDPDTERVPMYWGRIAGDCRLVAPDATEALGGIVTLSFAALHKALVDGYYVDEAGRRLLLHGTLSTAYLLAEGHLPS